MQRAEQKKPQPRHPPKSQPTPQRLECSWAASGPRGHGESGRTWLPTQRPEPGPHRSKDALRPHDELSAAELPWEDTRQDSGKSPGLRPPTQNSRAGFIQKLVCETRPGMLKLRQGLAQSPTRKLLTFRTLSKIDKYMHADGLLHSQHRSRCRKENRQGTDSAQPSPAPRAAFGRELHLHVLPALTDGTPCARWGDLKDFVPALDINYEQGALGVTHLASECSRRLGSLLGGMTHGRKERGKENLLSANALESDRVCLPLRTGLDPPEIHGCVAALVSG